MRVALIGYGYWGRRLLDLARRTEGLDVAVVVETDAARREAVPRPLAVVGTLDEALGTRIDGVMIATPADTHVPLIAAAIERGLHVWCEKPLALTSEELDRVATLAVQGGVRLQVDFQYLWSSASARLRSALVDGMVGDVVAVSLVRRNRGPVRFDVDAAWDLAGHDLSHLHGTGLLDGMRFRRRVDVMDGSVAGCVQADGETASGAPVQLHSCWLSDVSERRVVVAGRSGVLSLVEADGVVRVTHRTDEGATTLAVEHATLAPTPIDRALAEFAAASLDGRSLEAARDITTVLVALDRVERVVVPSIDCWSA